MKKVYTSPVFRYLDFLREEDPAVDGHSNFDCSAHKTKDEYT